MNQIAVNLMKITTVTQILAKKNLQWDAKELIYRMEEINLTKNRNLTEVIKYKNAILL